MKVNLNDKQSNKLNNLLNQLPISCTWIAEDIVEILNNNKIEDEDNTKI